MSKLPPRLQPLWPFAKRVHRLLTFAVGVVARRLRRLLGERAVPRGAVATVEGWAAHPDAGVVVHGLQPEAPLVREAPAGDPDEEPGRERQAEPASAAGRCDEG